MAYLTYTDYEDMGFAKISGPFSFEQLLERATSVLDTVTQHFYRKRELASDYPYRVTQFKKALGAQIEYLVENQGVTSNELNAKPTSVSMGRTSINYGERGVRGSHPTAKSLICPDVYHYLEGTGLLNRGV